MATTFDISSGGTATLQSAADNEVNPSEHICKPIIKHY